MVARILQFLYREVRGLHEAAYFLGGFALLSQILALVRDRVLAHSFGAGQTLDIYYAAFRIPDLVFVLAASLFSAYVLVPFIVERLESREELNAFTNSLFTFFTLFIAVIGGLAFMCAPILIHTFFPGFYGEAQKTLILFTQIMLLQPILLGISGFLASLVQARHKFILFGVSPLLYNIGIIIGVVFLYPMVGVLGLIYGVILGAFLHMIVQVPFLLGQNMMPRLTFSIDWPMVWRVVSISLPRTLTLSVNQIVLLVLVAIGSILAAGSISIFNFAFNLQSVPLAIIGASYSVAAFPTLARLFSEKLTDEFVLHVNTALRHILFWSLPAIVLFVVLRAQIVRVILGSGAFDWADTRLTAAALALFVVSLAAQAIILLLVRAYYASGRTWKPLAITLISGGISVLSALLLTIFAAENIAFRVFIESLLRVENIDGTIVLMLPLGYSIGVLVNMVVLLIFFQRDFGGIRELWDVFWKGSLASLSAGVAAYGGLSVLDDIFDIDTFTGILLQGFIAGIIGILVGVLVLRFLKSRELHEVWKSLHHKFWKTDEILPTE